MKAAVILSFVAAAVAGVVEPRECAGNNCAREVTGTRAGLLAITSRQADCSSFQLATVTPDATTVTVTVTVDEDESETSAPAKRDLVNRAATVTATAIPAYASSCTAGAEYASICSCWGITATTTTVATPTSTVTKTVTVDTCDDL